MIIQDNNFGIRCFLVPASCRQKVQDKINKLKSRAFKLGLADINLIWGSLETETRIINGQSKNIQLIQAHLSGPINICFDGWEFVATLQHLDTGENIIRLISDSIIIPDKYKTSGSICEHCNVNRYRKDTYLVKNKNNEFVQVGSSCIKDFLGHNSPDNIIQSAEFAANIVYYMNSLYQDVDKIHPDDILFDLELVLSQTSACIRDYGWVPKSKATDINIPTASRVLDHIDYVAGLFRSEINSADKLKAENAINWAENLTNDQCEYSNYLHNIRAIARSGVVNRKTIGYATSIISAFDRENKSKETNNNRCHVGTVKSREEFDVTFINCFTGYSSFGQYFKYTFEDENKNILIWFASSIQDFEDNKKYRIKATVKAHSFYKNVPQTEITRCNIVTYYESV